MPTSNSPEQSRLERLLGQAWNSLPMAALLVDQAGAIRYCSDQTSHLLGYETGHLIGMSIDRLMVQGRSGQQELSQSDAGGAPARLGGSLEFYARHRNGSTVPVHLSLTQVDGETQSEEIWTLVMMQDRRRPHQKTNEVDDEVERRYRQLFDQNQVGHIWARPDGKILSCNPAAAQMFGYDTSETLEGESFGDHFRGDLEERQRTIDRLREEGEVSQWNVPVKRRDGRPFTIMESLVLHEDADRHGTVVVSSFVEVTEQTRLWTQLKEMAYHDPLTGLPNRRFLQEQAKKALALAERHDRYVGLTYMDLNNFKAVNDQWGHETGDEVLVTVGERAERAIRESDVVARIGGDEFAVLWVDLDDPGAARPATRRIVQNIGEPVQVGDKRFSPVASAGIATFPDDGETVEKLLRQADRAMYRAKELEKPGPAIATTEQESS